MKIPPAISKSECIFQCEEVCRLALLRRYRLLPHIYTLFYVSHKKGTPVATPLFFAGNNGCLTIAYYSYITTSLEVDP
jgi:alpha-glucosidase (family GH31 glycosyl hydrolase)